VVYNKYIKMQGTGFFERDVGKLSPSIRKLLEQVGDEKINSIRLFRKPISLSSFAKFIGALKGTSYDQLLHLGLVLNNKYLLDKQEVIHFENSGVPSGSEILDVDVNKDITINELLEKTRKRMGDSNFTSYSARRNNCQDFVMNVLSANGLNSPEYSQFIKQDLQQVFENLPSYSEQIVDFVTGAQRVSERFVSGEGQRSYIHNFGLHRAKITF
jgi:hypothetical protein